MGRLSRFYYCFFEGRCLHNTRIVTFAHFNLIMFRFVLPLLVWALSFNFNFVVAQESQGGNPPSFLLSSLPSPLQVVVPKPDLDAIKAEDAQKDFYAIARLLPVQINLADRGLWHTLADGSRVLRLSVTLPDAKATSLYFSSFKLPPRGKLYIYNESKTQILGAFTAANNHESGLFATEITLGETVTLEYFQPADEPKLPVVEISDVAYVYRGVKELEERSGAGRDFGDALSCMVNVNCSEGANWTNQRNSVVRILLRIGSQQGWCSGSLLNNTAEDCKNYILTADHCGDAATTSNLTQWIFYFNYQAPGCANPASQGTLASQTRTGCVFRSRSTGGINSGSDFYLVELSQTIPANYNAFYAGWSRQNTASLSGVGIHHGAGDIKKISTYTQTLVSLNHSGFQNANGELWLVAWAATANGHGIIEQGSSGSPLFNSAGLVNGVASAGDVNMSCSNPSGYSTVYGKFSYSWESNGTANNRRLRPWLDPAGTNPTTLQGRTACGTTSVVADFVANTTTIFVGQSVNFTDLSTGSPTSWSWTFQGGTPATSTAQNPQNITYNTAGTYNVTLTASKTGSTNTATKTAYITVLPAQTTSCDTLRNFKNTDTESIFTAQGGGYVSGHNAFGDVAKADRFVETAGRQVSQVHLKFAVAKSNSPASKNFTVRIWDANGTAGAPGTVLGSVNVTYQTAIADVNASRFTVATFNPPITLNGPFYAGIEFAYAAGDTLALITNANGQTNPATAWEKLANSAWVNYGTANSWGVNVSHYIRAVVCNNPVAPPVANFTHSNATICAGSTVSFTNTSTGSPTAFSWVFQGGSPSTSTQQNPVVTYNTPGTYNVSLTVSNAGGNNTKTQNGLITVRANPSVNLTATDASCGNNGAVNSSVSGGQSPYTYQWTSSQTTANISGLSVGNYTVTVRDANTCSTTATAAVADKQFSVQPTVSNAKCSDAADGSILLNFTNATPPINISWNTGSNAQNLFGLSQGTYSVNVATANCSYANTFVVTAPAPISGTVSTTPTPQGSSFGTAIAVVSGGTEPYTYEWNTGLTTPNLGSLAPGVYTVTVTDNNNCSAVFQGQVDGLVGLDALERAMQVSVFPNPTTGILNLLFGEKLEGKVSIVVYSLLGSEVKRIDFGEANGNLMVLDLKDLPEAVYMLSVQSAAAVRNFQIVKTVR